MPPVSTIATLHPHQSWRDQDCLLNQSIEVLTDSHIGIQINNFFLVIINNSFSCRDSNRWPPAHQVNMLPTELSCLHEFFCFYLKFFPFLLYFFCFFFYSNFLGFNLNKSFYVLYFLLVWNVFDFKYALMHLTCLFVFVFILNWNCFLWVSHTDLSLSLSFSLSPYLYH